MAAASNAMDIEVVGRSARQVEFNRYTFSNLGFDRFTNTGFPENYEAGSTYVNIYTKDRTEDAAVHFLGPRQWSDDGIKLDFANIETPAEPPKNDQDILNCQWTITGKLDLNTSAHNKFYHQTNALENQVKHIMEEWNTNPKKHDPVLSAKPYDLKSSWRRLLFKQESDAIHQCRINYGIECFANGKKKPSTLVFLDSKGDPIPASFADCLRTYWKQSIEFAPIFKMVTKFGVKSGKV